jgi:regulator of cell morphogenesis and NO signaling
MTTIEPAIPLGKLVARRPGRAAPFERPPAHVEDRDWRCASLAELCDHIATVHDDRVRRALPQAGELLDSVMRVHGPVHMELRGLPAAFGHLRDPLEAHLRIEEETLLPGCRALEHSPGDDDIALDEALLTAQEEDHRQAACALAALRALTADYDTGRALCRTHRRLLEALHGLERDLHQHIHEENEILFPRVRAALAAGCT